MKIPAYFRTIRFMIGGLFTALIIISVMATTGYSDRRHTQTAIELADQLVETVGRQAIEQTTKHLGEARRATDLIGNHLHVNPGILQSEERLHDLMSGIILSHSDLYRFFIGYGDGTFYQVKRPAGADREMTWRVVTVGAGERNDRRTPIMGGATRFTTSIYDPRVRPWYQKVKDTHSPIWTKAYVFDSIQSLGITAASPIMQDEELIAVVGADILLEKLNGYLSGLEMGRSATALIINARDEIVGHSDSDIFVATDGAFTIPHFTQQERPEVVSAYDQQRERADLKERRNYTLVDIDGQKNVIVFMDFSDSFGTPWTLIIYAPVRQFLGSIVEIRAGVLLICALILLLAILLSSLLSRYISSPIVQLSRELDSIVGRDPDEAFVVPTKIRELRSLADALRKMHRASSQMLGISNAISAEMQLQPLLRMVVESTSDILDADRSTLFLYDSKTKELWSIVAEGVERPTELRFPSHQGIAGLVFLSGQTINIQDAYSDGRFNPEIDRRTGYKTRSVLCMQLADRSGKPLGVIQVLNKKMGRFTDIDEQRLRVFSAQIGVAIRNAQLFDEVVRVKNYNEAMLESLHSGIVTTDDRGSIVTANSEALRLFEVRDRPWRILGKELEEFFTAQNAWIAQHAARVLREGGIDEALDTTLTLHEDEAPRDVSVNVVIQPLNDADERRIGSLLTFEDITTEKRLRSTMARYISRDVMDKLMDEGDQALGGTLQIATILFSDIRSFTGFSERNGPQETVRMLNEYFTVMYDQIVHHEGILDKYIGDAIMAVFGAPFVSPQDADNALSTAVGMIRALRTFNADRVARGDEPIGIGVGINTGEVVSGNIGSEKRMDYTVIGDGVNLAARLEGATKVYSTPILISGFTRQALTASHRLREVDLLQVKGKQEPVAIFESIDARPEDTAAAIVETLESHDQGIARYREQDWASAKVSFHRVLQHNPRDALARLYIKRCVYFEENPPGEHWNGVWVMRSK